MYKKYWRGCWCLCSCWWIRFNKERCFTVPTRLAVKWASKRGVLWGLAGHRRWSLMALVLWRQMQLFCIGRSPCLKSQGGALKHPTLQGDCRIHSRGFRMTLAAKPTWLRKPSIILHYCSWFQHCWCWRSDTRGWWHGRNCCRGKSRTRWGVCAWLLNRQSMAFQEYVLDTWL